VTAENDYTFTHMGAVFLNAGKVMFGADGALEFSAGRRGSSTTTTPATQPAL
jgi:hypothetical protein